MKNKKIQLKPGINYEYLGNDNIPIMKYSFKETPDYTLEKTIVGNCVTARLTIINHVTINESLIDPINRRFLFKRYSQQIAYQNFFGHVGNPGSMQFNHLIDDATPENFGFNGYNNGENDILDLSYGLSTSSPSYNSGYMYPDLSSQGITCTYTPDAIPEQDGEKRIIVIEGMLI